MSTLTIDYPPPQTDPDVPVDVPTTFTASGTYAVFVVTDAMAAPDPVDKDAPARVLVTSQLYQANGETEITIPAQCELYAPGRWRYPYNLGAGTYTLKVRLLEWRPLTRSYEITKTEPRLIRVQA